MHQMQRQNEIKICYFAANVDAKKVTFTWTNYKGNKMVSSFFKHTYFLCCLKCADISTYISCIFLLGIIYPKNIPYKSIKHIRFYLKAQLFRSFRTTCDKFHNKNKKELYFMTFACLTNILWRRFFLCSNSFVHWNKKHE